DKTIIQRLLRSDIMKESVIYQEILLEGQTKGKAEGKAEGKTEATLQIARNMLRSGMTIEAISELTGLAIEQIQQLR
ncbi:MAG: Rpn family recombination-promoting nuclease/putative transposase, partial [Microcystaceae cyanobacterium]